MARRARRRERALQARRETTRSLLRALAPQDEPRRASPADQRPRTERCRRRAAALHPATRSRASSPPLRALPRARGHDRPLAGHGPRALQFGEALDMDVAYARGWSFGLDLRLLCRTPLALLRQASDGMTDGRRSRDRRRSGLGYWGPNLVRNLNELRSRRRVCLRPPAATASSGSAAAIRRSGDDELRRGARRPGRGRGRDRDRRSRPTTSWPGRRSRRESTSSSRSRWRGPPRRP